MVWKSLLAGKLALALAAILVLGSLPLAPDAFAARGGGHGGGGFHGGGGGFHGGFHGGGFRSGAFRGGGLTGRHGFAIHRGFGIRRGVAFHRPFFHNRFRSFHRGFGFYPYYGYSCYRWRRVLTPFGWRLRWVNACYPYYRHYYY